MVMLNNRERAFGHKICLTVVLMSLGHGMSRGYAMSTGINCTFDSGMCGWRQSSHDNFDWTWWTGPTTSAHTGPTADHTTGKGHYVYINASYPRVPKDRAKVVFSPFTGNACLTLHFYMHGPAVDELRVLLDGKTLLSIVGEKGDRWMTAQVQINASNSELVLEASVGQTWHSDIAVDDIFVSERCKVSGCPSLIGLQNANVTCSDGNLVGSTCNVSCLAGYNLLGPSSQTCLPSGVWSGSISNCAKVQVRLAGGNTSSSGRVEIAVNGVWGTICDDNWNVPSASVVCRMLGLPQASAVPGNSAFGGGQGVIWLDSVRCVGNETSIVQCAHKGWGAQDDCDHGEDAGIICGPVTAFGVRLAEGSGSNNGRVEVSINGIWGSVCDDHWSLEDAKVVCGMLGLPQATAATLGKSFGRGTGPVWLDDVKCVGNETSLMFCPKADLGVKDCAHFEDAGVVCGLPTISGQVNVALGKPTTQSSTLAQSDSFLAVDANYSTWSLTREETDPWWHVDLGKDVYIHTIHVIHNNSDPQIALSIGRKNASNASHFHTNCAQNWIVLGRSNRDEVFHCRPPERRRSLSLSLSGRFQGFSLCEVAVYAIESANETRGILREVWFGAVSTQDNPILRLNPVFAQAPHTFGLLQQFHIAPDFGTKYGQRLLAFVQPTESGLYAFQLACEDECELWVTEEKEEGLGISESTERNKLWMKLTRRTDFLQWDKYPDVQNSKEIYLSKCVFYSFEAFSRDGFSQGHLSVGWRLPDGHFERPIQVGNSRWLLPGERDVKFSLKGSMGNTSVKFGSTFSITALYRYCCHGMLCPNCPISLRFHALRRSFIVDDQLTMSCKDKEFFLKIDTHVEPGNYSMEARFSFTNDTLLGERRMHLGFLQVKVSVVLQCTFNTGLCAGWKNDGRFSYGGWMFGGDESETNSAGSFAFMNGSKSATLESPTLTQNEIANNVSLCLKFSFLISNMGKSNIRVDLKSYGSVKTLMRLTGYHGQKWSAAQVSWTSVENSKIVFESNCTETTRISVAIDDVKITTEKCDTEPSHAEPDHTCGSDEFQCDNGECVTASLRCDGDVACLDQSDERDCKCLSHQFSCPSGRCVAVTSLCDTTRDCEDGSDEERCELKCPEFQCVDGSCLPWTSTCSLAGKSCRDNTNFPGLCHGRRCSLNNLACKTEDETNSKCTSLRGYCTFDNGLCGFTHDESADFRWAIGQGATPSKDTGPSFDHTTLNDSGRYIFIEASQRALGDRARLISDWLPWNQSACLQFWYHMHGNNIGGLHIYLKTKELERKVWHQEGDQGDQWIFAQTKIEKISFFRVIIEGVVHDGHGGDIAIDDISLFDGECTHIVRNENPGCSFDSGTCNWRGHIDWRVSADPLNGDWRSLRGDYLYLEGGSDTDRTIISPPFNTGLREWKCVRFWYYSGVKYFNRALQLYVVSENGAKSALLWSHDQETMGWLFVQLPLYYNQSRTEKLLFKGWKQQPEPIVAVDDISFSKETCEKISAPTECYHYSVLNSADRLWSYSAPGTICDDGLDFNRWYRFTGAAGNQMVTWCVPFLRCGARYPGWMNGSHPAPDEGVVTRDVCFVLKGKCCRWKNKISVRNCGEFYVYKLTPPSYYNQRYCGHDAGGFNENNSREDWHEWKNLNKEFQWKLMDPEKLKDIDRSIEQLGTKSNLPEGLSQSRCYELYLPANGSGHVTLVGKRPSVTGMTMCLWVQTNQSQIVIDYHAEMKVGKIWAKPLTGNQTSQVVIMKKARRNAVTTTDGMWHHVCFTWTSESDTSKLYKDGALVTQKTHSATMFSGQETAVVNKSAILGKVSGFNIWSMSKDGSEISYLSYGGGENEGDVISWSTVTNGIKGKVLVKTPSICKHHEKPRLVATNPPKDGIAVFLSPWFERSANWYGSCLRFHYQLHGPGAQALRVYQRLSYNISQPLIWVDKDNSSPKRKSGEVSIAAVSKYQVEFKAIMTNRPGYIALGGFFISKEYCPSAMTQSREACNQDVTREFGYITSPYYPGYYTNSTTCAWRITAPRGYVIRLEFLAFQLENNWRCSKDFVELRDGTRDLSPVIGRYCGHTFPSFVESTSNKLTVTFTSDDAVVRTGFKAFYSYRKGNQLSCIQDCPSGCTCSRLSDKEGGILVTCSGLVTSPTPLPKQTVVIMAGRNKISRLQKEAFLNLPWLQHLDLSNNILLEIGPNSLFNLPSLKTLRLNGNFIKKIPVEGLRRLHELEILDFGENLIEGLQANHFVNISSLRVLGLRENKIVNIDDGAFNGLVNLSSLYLDGNRITTITKGTFKSLRSLETLFLHNNKLVESTISPDVFSEMKTLRHLTLDSFILCCYAEKSLTSVICSAPQAAISSCEDLLKTSIIRLSIWLLGIVALLGNALVIVWRAWDTKESRVQSILLTNLAISDLLMGVYLLLIAIQDTRWKGVYFQHDLQWRAGGLCQFAGALSVLSSEVSVFTLAVITADRLVAVVWPLQFKRLTAKSAHVICVSLWLLGALVAFFPLFGVAYFKRQDQDSATYFGRSAVCIPLQLSSERTPGWEYSASFFVALNFAIFVFILCSYVLIFAAVKKSARTAQTRNTKKEHRLAKRMIFIILTDFACWMPVIVIGVLALAGRFHDPEKQAYVWIAVFVLPVNSSINPILYTFSAPYFKRKLLFWSRRVGDASLEMLQKSSSKRKGKDFSDDDVGKYPKQERQATQL